MAVLIPFAALCQERIDQLIWPRQDDVQGAILSKIGPGVHSHCGRYLRSLTPAASRGPSGEHTHSAWLSPRAQTHNQ